MATTDKAIILTKSYDFLKLMIQVVRKFPRDQKFMLGDRIQNHAADILEWHTEAYYSSDIALKIARLQQVNLRLEMLRYYVRLCFENGYYDSNKYKLLIEKADELGRMTGKWIAFLQKKVG